MIKSSWGMRHSRFLPKRYLGKGGAHHWLALVHFTCPAIKLVRNGCEPLADKIRNAYESGMHVHHDIRISDYFTKITGFHTSTTKRSNRVMNFHKFSFTSIFLADAAIGSHSPHKQRVNK
jgi:hypothetical protein